MTTTAPAPLQPDAPGAQRYANPYLAGAALGVTLLLSYVTLGAGLGASAAPARVATAALHAIAPAPMENNGYVGGWFSEGSPLSHYLVFMTLGTLLGGLLSAKLARRVGRWSVERGPTATSRTRLALAVVGGLLVGFASRLAAGCTSGQALSGGALLFTGSWAFMAAMFLGAFLVAPLVRKEWH
ncbi:MAG: YeeE/YedE thiosulfate transporter family protein [Myxococcales bacterium]|nr:YeeE/YedE thiosulfate transporter family protein [Myxococcales bacterium]MDP3500630.1 YeeE/YedE thiosulfate transporter family protein [Myxococcales bacterium]